VTAEEFDTWRQQVFKPFATENKDDHTAILKRLDSLNGFHNKLLGAAALIGFCTPLTVAIWAILATT
jgi:hypothetical protein